MHTLPTRFLPGIAAAIACATCLAFAPAVEAQAPPPRPGDARAPMPPREGPTMERGGPGMHGMRMMRGVERLKTSLQLTPQQATLWDRAVAQMKPAADVHEQMKGRHERLGAMLDDPNFDPRRMAAEMDRAEADHKARRTAIRDAWFSVYEALNPVQRGQVREFLRARMSRDHHETRGGRGDGMHHDGMHHDADKSRAPVPPTAPSPPR